MHFMNVPLLYLFISEVHPRFCSRSAVVAFRRTLCGGQDVSLVVTVLSGGCCRSVSGEFAPPTRSRRIGPF